MSEQKKPSVYSKIKNRMLRDLYEKMDIMQARINELEGRAGNTDTRINTVEAKITPEVDNKVGAA